MSAWPGKYVIGLTGNIATGKSEVRRMLQKLGAYGIDADALAHQVIARGEPAYAAVLESFGDSILSSNGQIDRLRLGQIVFPDPAALARLEAIIHPQVRKMIDHHVRQAKEPVVVIEAIKLLEAGYLSLCDSIWVTSAPEELQIDRLMRQRSMSEETAYQRIHAQPDQAKKIAAANVIIDNASSLAETWRQVTANWEKIFPLR
jgi:dephospho-CoA kinase